MRTTNRQAKSIISGALLRIAVERNKSNLVISRFEMHDKSIAKALEKSPISDASKGLIMGCNTIMKKRLKP